MTGIMVALCSEAAVVSRRALGSSCLAQTCKKDWAKHGARPLSIEREGKTMVGVRNTPQENRGKQAGMWGAELFPAGRGEDENPRGGAGRKSA